MDGNSRLVVINLIPQRRPVRQHLDRIASIAQKKGYQVEMFHPTSVQALRRAMLSRTSWIYVLGHAEPDAGLELLNEWVKWRYWQQLFQEFPHHSLLNFCYSQPGDYWQLPNDNTIQVHGHEGLIERNAAYEWGERRLEEVLGV